MRALFACQHRVSRGSTLSSCTLFVCLFSLLFNCIVDACCYFSGMRNKKNSCSAWTTSNESRKRKSSAAKMIKVNSLSETASLCSRHRSPIPCALVLIASAHVASTCKQAVMVAVLSPFACQCTKSTRSHCLHFPWRCFAQAPTLRLDRGRARPHLAAWNRRVVSSSHSSPLRALRDLSISRVFVPLPRLLFQTTSVVPFLPPAVRHEYSKLTRCVISGDRLNFDECAALAPDAGSYDLGISLSPLPVVLPLYIIEGLHVSLM